MGEQDEKNKERIKLPERDDGHLRETLEMSNGYYKAITA